MYFISPFFVSKKRLSAFVLCAGALLLSGCAYLKNDTIQELTVLTPGAQNTLCFVYVDKLKYKFRPPQTQTIIRSNKDLIIDCLAPGNRRREVMIVPKISGAAYENVLNVGVGALWDKASSAAYSYPHTVEIDFTHMPLSAEPLPAHNNPDIRQPEDYRLEEFLPSTPRLNEDIGGAVSDPAGNTDNAASPQQPKGKGDLMDIIRHMF